MWHKLCFNINTRSPGSINYFFHKGKHLKHEKKSKTLRNAILETKIKLRTNRI